MEIALLYSSDDAYVSEAGVSIISLLENNKDFDAVTIHYIDCGLSGNSKEILEGIVRGYGREIIFYPLGKVLEFYTINAPKPSYYGRLLAPFFIDADKVLYLDCDLLITSPLEDLWNTDVENYALAAVQDAGILPENLSRLNIPSDARYINSGMLLINLKYWREHDTAGKLIDYLNKNGEIPPYHDQNIINAVCYDETLIIPPKYNLLWSMLCAKPGDIRKLNKIPVYYTDEEIKDAVNNPVIIHFSYSIYGRPWKEGCHHRYKELYLHYRKLSPWGGEPLEKNNISAFRKFRNALYRALPGRAYCTVQRFERWLIKNVVLKLPENKFSSWVGNYTNGK